MRLMRARGLSEAVLTPGCGPDQENQYPLRSVSWRRRIVTPGVGKKAAGT